MQRALSTLTAVLADPGAPGAADALAALRERWAQLAPDERAALTPLAKLAAQRVEQAAGPVSASDSDEDAYLAYLASIEATVAADAEEAPLQPYRRDAPPPARGGDAGGGARATGRADWMPAPPAPVPTLFSAPDSAPTLFAVATPPPPAPTARPPERRTPLEHITPDTLLGLLGLSSFRPGQREAVQAALDGRDALVVMPTGGGKSLCYQLPALAGTDLTVVVSPLIALMRDQCARLTDLGHPAVMLASGGDGDANRQALASLRDGSAVVCFAAPERFASAAFRAAISRRAIALFVVDEAHCVSEWGHDFRPDYLRLSSVIAELGHPPVMACTATATPKVAEEIVARLGLREPARVRSGLDRPNLSFDVLPFDGEGSMARKRATLLAGLAMAENRPAVVYCGTRKSTEEVAALLAGEGLGVVAYHAGMNAQTRSQRQDAFMRGDADVVVATNAFGMGVDKADVRSVWHCALPSSLEAYYQEAEVTVEQVGAIVGRLRARASEEGAIELSPDDDRDRIALAVAERAGALTLAPGAGGRVRVQLVGSGELDHGRARQLCREAKNRRWESYRSIERYAAGDERCRRRQLLDHFGDPAPVAPTGRCCDVDDPPDWLPAITVAAKRARSGGGAQGAPAEDGPPVSDAEMAPLKAWRRDRADGKPAFTVATDATLREVVRRRPRTADELLAIKGIGPSFVTKHAESLLELLAAS